MKHSFSTLSDGLKNKELSLDPILIFESLPMPALLYDRTGDCVIRINSRLAELLNLRVDSIVNLPIKQIIPGELDSNPTGNSDRPVRLRLSSGNLIVSQLQIFPASQDYQRVLMTFTPPVRERNKPISADNDDLALDDLSYLTLLGKQKNQPDLLEKAAQLIERVIDPKFLLLYEMDSEKDSFYLRRIPGRQFLPEYPKQVSAFSLSQLGSVCLWVNTSKPISDVHTHALGDEEQTVLSVPVIIENKLDSIIFAVGVSPDVNEKTINYLNLLSAHLSVSLQNLRRESKQISKLNRLNQIVQVEHAITDNLEQGIIILSPDLRIAELNPTAEIMFGYAGKEVFNQPADAVLIGNESLMSLYRSAQEGVVTLGGNPISLNTRNGKTFSAQVTCLPIKSAKKLLAIVVIVKDLSQSEQFKTKSQQLEQRAVLGEVAAIFAHEVRNPINSLSTGLQFMQMGMKPTDANYTLTEHLQSDCMRLTHLVETILNFTKPIEFRVEPLDVAGFLKSIIERWAPRMTRLNIHFTFQSKPEKPMVKADVLRLEQVFVNLISNAIQAMEATGGSLGVRIFPNEEIKSLPQYEIVISDTGPGIPEELRAHIFEPFVTTKNSGTGLGLAISKRIISAHKGNISVESFPGGTLFHVKLPQA